MADGGSTERAWEAERRSFGAQSREDMAAERERLARGRDRQADERQRAAESRSDARGEDRPDRGGDAALDTGWEVREAARLARKNAAQMRVDAARSRQQAEAARRAAGTQYPLAARFAELAGHLFAAGRREEVLARILAAAVEVIDGVDMASLSLATAGGGLTTPSYTEPVALRLDELQYETGEGPCVEVSAASGAPYLMALDIGLQRSWPVFGPLASRLGLRAVLSIGLLPPLAADGPLAAPPKRPRLGSLNLYARRRRAFDDNSRDVALLLAAHAAVALAGSAQASQLRDALDSRDVIGQAKGILMARRDLTADEAFDALRRTSQRLNLKLRDVAARIAETHSVPPPD